MALSKGQSRLLLWIGIVLSVLLVIYGFLGFLLLPWWAESKLPQTLKEQMGWEASIEDIQFNPFDIAATLSGFEARNQQDETVVRFDRLAVDLGFWSLVGGLVDLESIELEQPFVRLDLLDDYSLNLVNDWQQQHAGEASPPEEPNPQAAQPGAPLFIDRAEIVGGSVLFRDLRGERDRNFQIQPMNLELADLAIYPREDGESASYQLTARIGDSQQLEWEGSLSLWPFQSQGHLALANIQHDTLWHFAAPYAPYTLTQGAVDLDVDYQLAYQDQLRLSLDNGDATLSDVRVEQDGQPLLQFNQLKVAALQYGLNAASLAIGDINLSDWQVDLSRTEDGNLQLMAPFQSDSQDGSEGTSESQPEAASNDPGLNWSIQHIGLEQGRVNWQDATVQPPAKLAATDINLDLQDLNAQPDHPVIYRLKLALDTGGSLQSDGELTLQPFTMESDIQLGGVQLAALEPYLRPNLAAQLKQGALDFKGQLSLDNQEPKLTGTLVGQGQVQSLGLYPQDDDEAIAQWEQLAIDPLRVTLDPLAIDIGKVDLTGPDIRLVLNSDGTTNLGRLFVASKNEDETPSEPQDSGQEGQGPILRIDRISLSKGALSFTDRTTDPNFTEQLHDLSGTVVGLTNQPPQQADVQLNGKVGGEGKLSISGTIAALGTDATSHFKAEGRNITLTPLSPYFGRYLGYKAEKGKLKLDLDYKLQGLKLDAANALLFDQFYLGEATDSDTATDAPIKLGLALLRDSDGNIDVNLPISGDLSDPSFSVTHVVLKAFTNLVIKAASSPFNALGGLVELAGLTGEDLSQVRFIPGQAQLASGENKELSALAEGLKQKSELVLDIRGAYAQEKDAQALREQKVLDKNEAGRPLGERIRLLEQRLDAGTVEQLKAEHNVSGEDRLTSQKWYQTLMAQMADKVELDKSALRTLATERAKAIQRRLVEQGVDAQRLYLLESSSEAKVVDDSVAVPLTMRTR
ncbi:DUF748 domain-containing protein [Marinobacteraceae bacterium S3BR75-40.1]